jgi:hypothetical protein
MPASTIAAFDDPWAFEAALQPGLCAEVLATEQGRFQAEFVSIALPRLSLLRGSGRLSRISIMSVAPGTMLIILPTRPGHILTYAGTMLAAGEVMTVTAGERLHTWTRGPCRWAAISVSAAEFITYGRAVIGRDFRLRPGVCLLRPKRTNLQSLTALFEAAMRLTEALPMAPIRTDAASRGLEQGITHALVRVLSAAAMQPDGAADWRRATMTRLELLRNGDGPPVREVSAAVSLTFKISPF